MYCDNYNINVCDSLFGSNVSQLLPIDVLTVLRVSIFLCNHYENIDEQIAQQNFIFFAISNKDQKVECGCSLRT